MPQPSQTISVPSSCLSIHGSASDLSFSEAVVAPAVCQGFICQLKTGRDFYRLDRRAFHFPGQPIQYDITLVNTGGQGLPANFVGCFYTILSGCRKDVHKLSVSAGTLGQTVPQPFQPRRQFPVPERGPVSEGAGFSFQHIKVMPWIVDGLVPVKASCMASNLFPVLPLCQDSCHLKPRQPG